MKQAVLKHFPSDIQPVALLVRLSILATIFFVELLVIPVVAGREFLATQVSDWGPVIVRSGIAFAILFSAFAYIRHPATLVPISTDVDRSPVNWALLGTHVFFIAIFTFISSAFYGNHSPIPLTLSPAVAATVWLLIALAAIGSASFALIRPIFWLRIARATPLLWTWAAVAGLSTYFAAKATKSLGAFAIDTTFHLSQALLHPLLPGLIADPVNRLIGTTRFMVALAPACSGLEGIGLILVFGISCLAVFRKDFRFPHAFLLLPVAVVTVFVFNSFRIAALVLIGNAGAIQIAMHGFHSEAGWMVFCLVAIGFSLAARKVPWWLSVTRSVAALPPQVENPTAKWLLPFVILLAVGMLSAAGTGSFEWFYPVRFFAVVLTLSFMWRSYTKLDFSVSWWAPAIGVAVFLVWIGLDRIGPGGSEVAPLPLFAASPLLRTVWLVFRVLATTITVPIAEELAFRGFLYRRLQSADFEQVSLRHFSWIAMLVASLAFGLMHGNRWFVGSVAGALYTLVLVRRGSMGDAIAAHSTTNALLAFDVLAFHRWHLW